MDFVYKTSADNFPYHVSLLLSLAVERLCEDSLLFFVVVNFNKEACNIPGPLVLCYLKYVCQGKNAVLTLSK